jgi:hypothetical protein
MFQYERTVDSVYQGDESVDTLVELLVIYREKGGDIFPRICMLLGILANDPARRMVSYTTGI